MTFSEFARYVELADPGTLPATWQAELLRRIESTDTHLQKERKENAELVDENNRLNGEVDRLEYELACERDGDDEET